MPDIRAEYVKALGSLARKPRGEVRIPRLELALPAVSADAGQLAAYRRICGFGGGDSLPITYPQVLAAPLQMRLLTRSEFPLPLLGLVHLRNRIEQKKPLPADASYQVDVGVGNSHQTDKGLEFDLVTSFADGQGAELWRAVATVLFRNRKPSGGNRKPAAEPEPAISDYVTFDAPADIGRRYGRVSGDLNPIHLTPWTAKLFGFPRAIAHGMWSLARCAALLEGPLGREPKELTVQFRQPLLLPGRVALRYKRDASVINFVLLNRGSGKTHLTGALG
ncbi:MAG: hypothetical protein HYV18_09010 [Gammaproteobacteria bacterium]|nr:hypothetical protein [Gammaproteobacteria bacterium]